MGGKTQTTNTANTSSTTPNGLAQLQDIYSRAQSAASTPYTPYGGQLTAGLTDTQNNAVTGANTAANLAQPYYGTAANYATQGASTIDPASISKYMNPYTQSVVNATQANFNESNGQQQQQVIGNAALKGALGGDRVGVAQAELARQQKLAQDPVIAGLNQSNYTQALGAAQADRTAAQTGASQFAGIGTGAQNAAEQGVTGQLTAGGVQQQTNQTGLTNDYQQFLNQQAYPFQTAQFLAGIGLPAASAMGTTTSGTGSTTSPGPNPFVQAAGLGLSAASLFSDERVKDGVVKIGETYDGQPIYRYSYKGDPTVRIGLIAQDVEKENPEAVGESHGVKTVNYDKATKDSAEKGSFASGGAVSPFNFITDAKGYVPAAQTLSGGSQPAQANAGASGAPAAASSADPLAGIDKQLQGMKGSLSGLFSPTMGSPGVTDPLSVIGGAGGYAVPTFMARGGSIRKAGGGGLTLDERFSGSPFSSPDDNSIIIPDPGLQKVDPAAMQAWRDGVDRPNPALVADSSVAIPVPAPTGNPMTSSAKIARPSIAPDLPPEITGGSSDTGLPASAMAFDATGTQNPMTAAVTQPQADNSRTMGGFNPFNLSDKARQAIIAGGLGVAASKSPFALSAIGEGGQAGLKTYSQMTAAEKEAADKLIAQKQNQQRIDQEAKRITQSAEQFTKNYGLNREKFDYEKNNQEKAVQYLGPASDGSGSVMMDKKSGRIYVEPVSVAGGKPSPIQAATVKADVNKVGEYSKAADGARDAIATLDNIDQLRKDAYTGPVVGRLASAVGHPATAALESQTNALALNLAQKMKGSLSDKDVAFLKAQVPNLNQTGSAGEATSSMIRAGLERSAQKGDFFRDWLDVHGSLAGANKSWDRYSNENSLFTDDKKAVGGRRFNPDYNKDYSAYLGAKGAPSARQPDATSSLPQAPRGVPPGSAYSPSRKMWRSPDGQMFDASGAPVQG